MKEKIKKEIFEELVKEGQAKEEKNKVYNLNNPKLWFLTEEQAKEFLNIERKDPKQKMFVKEEKEILKSKTKEIESKIKTKSINIIDLGCGNGEKAKAILSSLKKEITYFPIDINDFMLKSALKNISKLKKIKVEFSKNNKTDFMNLKKIVKKIKKKTTNVFLLLGGNFENNEPHQLLHEIRSIMKENDFLLIGNKLSHPSVKKMINYYKNNKLIENLMKKTLELGGFDLNSLSYSARFKGNRIEIFFIFKKDQTISALNKTFSFKKGDKIIVGVSYKYTEEKLRELLGMYFSDNEIFISKNKNFFLALCKK